MTNDQLLWAYVAKEETYPEDTMIIEEGSRGDWVYVILEGRAKVTKRTSEGVLTLGSLEKGAVFGEMGFFGITGGIRSASIIAADGPVRVGVLDSQLLRRDYEALSKELRELLKTLIMRLNRASEKICSMVGASG
ncbi:MAG: cyclic nucleotide-binding domain-containing protein [Deltaproteobacteria bacterium]|nr:MAG: cyclic nucleotide-binding domain-containing protein [Deltaproteobacteria bacterium]